MAMILGHSKGTWLASVILLLVALPCTYAQYSGGTGEPNDPYRIATAADLILLGETAEDYDKHFILTADIDLSDWTFDKSVIAGGPFVSNRGTDRDSGPSGDIFTGNIDGQGFTVRKLKILADSFYTGLFGYISKDGVVSNLILEDVSVDGRAENTYMLSGGVASQNAGTILNCSVTGTMYGVAPTGGLSAENTGLITNCGADVRIQGTGARVGGLVGRNHGVIVGCYAFGSVSAEAEVGGLVGENDGEISSSYSLCTTMAETTTAGGLVGLNEGSITDCQSHGSVQAVAMVGGLAGVNESTITSSYSTTRIQGEHWTGGLVGSDKGNSTASFWDTQTSGLSHSDGGVGLSTAEMQDPNTYLDAGWDFVGETENGPNDIWKIVAGQTYPLLSWQKYGGGTGEPNDPYLLYTAGHLNDLGADTNDYDKHFRLMADIDLWEYTYDSAVIAVGETTVRGTGYSGTWFSGIFNGNSHKISHLTIQGEGENCSGLFGGIGAGAQVHDLRLEAVDVNYTGSGYTGSLAGISGGDISNCSCDGRVIGTSMVGGLVGKNGYHGHGSISASFSAGEVSGYNQIGGLVGSNGANIRDCYSIASVEATGGFGVGGFVGVHHSDNIITNCYSIGRVVGGADPWRVGGLIGANGNPIYDLKVASSFWDIESSGMIESQGGTGLSTVDMQTASTFLQAGWDFVGEDENGTEDIWTMPDNDYPRLAWERTDPAPCQATVIELSNRNLDIMEQGVVLVEFYAPWCSFCQQQAPILDDVACQVSEFAKVAKLNIDTMRDVAETYGIMAIPTLIIFRDGAEVKRIVGLTQARELVEAIQDAVK